MAEAKTVALKLAAEFRRGDREPSQVTVSVEGQGELAEQVALAVSESVQRLLREHAATTGHSVVVPIAPDIDAASPVQTVQPLDWAPVERRDPAATQAGPQVNAPLQSAPPRQSPWFKRHRARITTWTGIALLTLAVIVPLLAPPALRREVWPMPVAFGVAGALCLMSALLPERGSAGDARLAPGTARPSPARARPEQSSFDAQRIAQLSRPGIAQRAGGLVFGLVLALGGLFAPFLLPGGADERFLMMLGFAPIAVIGLLLMWVFARRSMRAGVRTVGGAEAALLRQRSSFQAYAPTVIVGLVLLLGSVLIVVVVATMLPLLTR
jgi:hypothetical protein